MVKHSCAPNCGEKSGCMILGNFILWSKVPINSWKKKEEKPPKCQEVFSIWMLLESSKSSWKTILITLQHTSKTEQKKVIQEEWKKQEAKETHETAPFQRRKVIKPPPPSPSPNPYSSQKKPRLISYGQEKSCYGLFRLEVHIVLGLRPHDLQLHAWLSQLCALVLCGELSPFSYR